MVIRDTSLQFTWHDQTGEVNGRDADIVLALAEGPVIPFGPEPMGWHPISPDALGTRQGIALVIGVAWAITDAFGKDYPVHDDGIRDTTYTDADGVIVLGRDRITY